MQIKAIGVVHSPIKSTREMPISGSPATVEVFPEYLDGLLGVETNSHLVFVFWMHEANRQALRLDRIGPENIAMKAGVFSLRSPSRPNPLGITTGRLLRVEGGNLHLDRLDTIDGTPVMDIKGYSLGWDAVFSARSLWDGISATQRDPEVLLELIRTQAVNFHGRVCRDLLLGVKLFYDLVLRWDVSMREPALKFIVGSNGCIADALQGATGATLGNGRLRWQSGNSVIAMLQEAQERKALRYTPKSPSNLARFDDAEVLRVGIDELFEVAIAEYPTEFDGENLCCRCGV